MGTTNTLGFLKKVAQVREIVEYKSQTSYIGDILYFVFIIFLPSIAFALTVLGLIAQASGMEATFNGSILSACFAVLPYTGACTILAGAVMIVVQKSVIAEAEEKRMMEIGQHNDAQRDLFTQHVTEKAALREELEATIADLRTQLAEANSKATALLSDLILACNTIAVIGTYADQISPSEHEEREELARVRRACMHTLTFIAWRAARKYNGRGDWSLHKIMASLIDWLWMNLRQPEQRWSKLVPELTAGRIFSDLADDYPFFEAMRIKIQIAAHLLPDIAPPIRPIKACKQDPGELLRSWRPRLERDPQSLDKVVEKRPTLHTTSG